MAMLTQPTEQRTAPQPEHTRRQGAVLMATALATPVVAFAVLLVRGEQPAVHPCAPVPDQVEAAGKPAASAPPQFPPWPEPRPARDEAAQEPAPTF